MKIDRLETRENSTFNFVSWIVGGFCACSQAVTIRSKTGRFHFATESILVLERGSSVDIVVAEATRSKSFLELSVEGSFNSSSASQHPFVFSLVIPNSKTGGWSQMPFFAGWQRERVNLDYVDQKRIFFDSVFQLHLQKVEPGRRSHLPVACRGFLFFEV